MVLAALMKCAPAIPDGAQAEMLEEIALSASVLMNWRGSITQREMETGTGTLNAPTKERAIEMMGSASAFLDTKAKLARVNPVRTIVLDMELVNT
mmetsp:Transcript_41262/g.74373  ORF Transcript_41262/g.74373 Transcript_41262/m.74373 type:complete len:95 (-) Transcript_41262:973-1257(-)